MSMCLASGEHVLPFEAKRRSASTSLRMSTLEEMLDCSGSDDSTGMTDREAREALERCVYCHGAPPTRWLGYVRELSQIPYIFSLVARWLEWRDPFMTLRDQSSRYTNTYKLLRKFEMPGRLGGTEIGTLVVLALEVLLKHANALYIPLKLLDPPPTGSSTCLFHMPRTHEESAILELIVRDANARGAFIVDIFPIDKDNKLLRIRKRCRDTKAN